MTVFAPSAPRPYRCNQAMSLDEAKLWIDCYNRWVEVWNKHETTRRPLPNPEWPEADKVASGIGCIPKSVFAFYPKGAAGSSGPAGLMRIKGWESYCKGSMCRNPINASNIIWGGWRVRPALTASVYYQPAQATDNPHAPTP